MGLGKQKVDFNDVMKGCTQGFKLMSQFSELATGTVQDLTQLQAQFAKETMEDMSGVVRQLMASPAGQRLGLTQKAMTDNLNRVMAHSNAITQKVAEAGVKMSQKATPSRPGKKAAH